MAFCGRPFAAPRPVMNPLPPSVSPRRKAVWGPKRTIATALIVMCGLATEAFAASHPVPGKARPGRPNAFVKTYKLDGELVRRSDRLTGTTRAIIELAPGAQLPAEFKAYARRNGRLRIINGQV